MTSIGKYAFHECSSLTSIVVAEENEVYDSRNGCNAIIKTSSNTLIQGCSTTIIPDGVTSIGSSAFSGCSSLTSITLPEGVTSIEGSAFSNCSRLTSITIPEGVTSIGSSAFEYCSSLTSITLPEGVTSIGSSAFADCSSLTAITIPEGVMSIGKRAFSGCTSLTSITIPEGVTSFGDYAFYYCSSLAAITIPGSVTSFGDNAFSGCSNLKELSLGAGLTTVPTGLFVNCVALEKITSYSTRPPRCEGDIFSKATYDNAVLYVPKESVDKYQVMAGWSAFYDILALPTYVANITLSQSEAMLTEGETVTLTATVTPDDATDKTLTWSSSDERVATVDAAGLVTALAPGTATITVAANDGSGVSASCVVTVKAKPTVRCAAPVMDYVDGQVVLTCDTEGVEFVTDVVAEGAQRYQTSTFDLAAVYTITAYATKEGYLDSDPVTLTLCWVPCTEEHEDDDTDGIITLPAKPVLIQTAGGVITLTGLPDGAEVAVYDTAGTSLATATAENGTATLTTNLNTGSTALVKIGGHSVKVVVK